MVQLVFLIAGIAILFLKRIPVTAGVSEVRRPKTFILGGLLIACAVLQPIIDKVVASSIGGDYSAGITDIALILLPLIAVVFLKEPKESPPTNPQNPTA